MIEILEEGLDEQGMAMDFVKVKSTVGKWIDESLDHRVFLAKDDPLAEVLRAAGEEPILFDGNPTAELLAKKIFERARDMGLNVKRVDFWETKNCRATYALS